MEIYESIIEEYSTDVEERTEINLPVCPLCGQEKDALVNCGAHENSFTDIGKLRKANKKLYSIIGSGAEYAYDIDENDCFVCQDCRSNYLQFNSYCPLYVLYQGIYSFFDEQKAIYDKDESEAMKMLWNVQSNGKADPNALIHRFKLICALDDNLLSGSADKI